MQENLQDRRIFLLVLCNGTTDHAIRACFFDQSQACFHAGAAGYDIVKQNHATSRKIHLSRPIKQPLDISKALTEAKLLLFLAATLASDSSLTGTIQELCHFTAYQLGLVKPVPNLCPLSSWNIDQKHLFQPILPALLLQFCHEQRGKLFCEKASDSSMMK